MGQLNYSFRTRAQAPAEGVVINLVIHPDRKPVTEVSAFMALPTFRVENCRGGWGGVIVFKVTCADRYAHPVAVDAQERQSLDALE